MRRALGWAGRRRAGRRREGRGTSSPDAVATRGAVLTILYRLAGEPAPCASDGPWYGAAQDWAVRTGLSDGRNMDGTITREQLVLLLYRYTALQGKLEGPRSAGSERRQAMRWAVECGLLEDSADGLYGREPASRGEVSDLLARYCRLFLL